MRESAERRLVLITGASAGIGEAAARAFVARGDRVLGVARRRDRLEGLSRALGGADGMAALEADVADVASMEALVAEVLERYGIPDVVVANAGIGLNALFVETTDEALRELFEVNVFGVVRTIRPFVGPMTARGRGRLLIVSSVVGRRGLPYYSAYSASKFALHGMADALHSELWNSGVSLGLVCPSSTGTEFQERQIRVGPGQRRVRPQRHSAERVARHVVRMAGSRRRELLLSAEGRVLVWADAVLPRLVDAVLARLFRHRR